VGRRPALSGGTLTSGAGSGFGPDCEPQVVTLVRLTPADGPNGDQPDGTSQARGRSVLSVDWTISHEPVRPSGEALPWPEDDGRTEVGHAGAPGDRRAGSEGETEMTGTNEQGQISELDVFVGEWAMTASFAPSPAEAPRASTVFEWLSGKRFLVQRWEVGHPEAPDGIAIIGLGSATGNYRQYYFDSRGVVRVYEMTFDGNTWALERRATKPDFSQRFTGNFRDQDTVVGRWERSDDGSNWTHDFDLTYARVR
jgi:hypothetical protein